jgi:hypothetical protein
MRRSNCPTEIGGRFFQTRLQSAIVRMWLWLWKIWFQIMGLICFLSDSEVPSSRGNEAGFLSRALTRKCDDMHRLLAETKMAELLYRHQEFGSLISETDSSWDNQLVYWWENITVLVPDPESQLWTDLRITQEFRERGCNSTNSKWLCPHIRKFLERHLIDGNFPEEGRKRKTKAGNKIWWNQVGQYEYIYPAAVRILGREEALNGEVIIIERPLHTLLELNF